MTYMQEPTSLTDEQFDRISGFVRGVCGINLHTGKKELVKARLGRRLRTLGLASFEDYFDFVREDSSGDEVTAMLDALATNLTSFFREPRHFAYLSERVLPPIRKGASRRIRVWSAGCSSGEEPYTIAIVLNEAIGDLSCWDAKILATDLSTKVLGRARTGVYDAEKLEEVPRSIVVKYFEGTPSDSTGSYQAGDRLRRLITFARLNLLGEWPMKGPFDAIFCRNVMIYFDRETQLDLVNRFVKLLAPGGILFVGHAESLAGGAGILEYVEPAVYRKP